MNRTEIAVNQLLGALAATAYDVGICSDRGMLPNHNGLSAGTVLKRIPFLRYQNAQGNHIYIRPSGEHPFTLLDDLNTASLKRLEVEGYGPAAVIETSPGNFQAWLKHSAPLRAALSTLAARRLAAQFNADPSSADWRHFGRMPGFTNCKLKYRLHDGRYPFALLRSSSGSEFSAAHEFRAALVQEFDCVEKRHEAQIAKRHRTLSPQKGERFSHLSLPRFRQLPIYESRPAQADIAFCVAAYAAKMPEISIARALEEDYLSLDRNEARKQAYLQRTMRRARRWSSHVSGGAQAK